MVEPKQNKLISCIWPTSLSKKLWETVGSYCKREGKPWNIKQKLNIAYYKSKNETAPSLPHLVPFLVGHVPTNMHIWWYSVTVQSKSPWWVSPSQFVAYSFHWILTSNHWTMMEFSWESPILDPMPFHRLHKVTSLYSFHPIRWHSIH